jgi:hypothetical protein
MQASEGLSLSGERLQILSCSRAGVPLVTRRASPSLGAGEWCLTVPTIQKFENGLSGNITLGTFLLLMKAIGCINGLEELMPEQPESPYLYYDNNKKMQRVCHKRKEL